MGEAGPWVWTTDGTSREIAGATTLRLRITEDGATFAASQAHVVVADGGVQWFTDCGTPLPGAP